MSDPTPATKLSNLRITDRTMPPTATNPLPPPPPTAGPHAQMQSQVIPTADNILPPGLFTLSILCVFFDCSLGQNVLDNAGPLLFLTKYLLE